MNSELHSRFSRAQEIIRALEDELREADRGLMALTEELDVRAAALEESESRYRLMIEGSDQVFFFAHDTEDRFTYLSPSVELVLGYPPDHLLGRPYTDLLTDDPENRHLGPRTEDSLATGDRGLEYSIVVRHQDGRDVCLEIVEQPVLRDGHPIGMQGFARDVTEQVRRRKALDEAREILAQAQKLDAVGRLAGGVAHDFNNLLTAIRGHADFAVDLLPTDSEARAELDEIRRGVDRAAGLTSQLLAFSRQQVIQPRVVDVAEQVREIEKMLRRVIGADIQLVTNLGDGHVNIDPGQLQQVIMNLVINARDAMPEGGRLTVNTHVTTITAAEPARTVDPGCYVVLTVADNGIGIAECDQEHIFEPFFTTKDPGKGTGLGLASVYGIVTAAGGSVQVRSERGNGTTFAVYLPHVAEPVEDPDDFDTPTLPGPAAPAAPAATILLVEDDHAVRRLTARVLRRHGHDVIEAAEPAEALQLDSGLLARVDLVLSDLVMPGMHGHDMILALRGLRPGIPVVFMSGYARGEGLRKGVASEKFPFIEKPFTMSELVERVDLALHEGDA